MVPALLLVSLNSKLAASSVTFSTLSPFTVTNPSTSAEGVPATVPLPVAMTTSSPVTGMTCSSQLRLLLPFAMAGRLSSNSVPFVMLATVLLVSIPVPVIGRPTTSPAVLSQVTVSSVSVTVTPVSVPEKPSVQAASDHQFPRVSQF